MSDLEVRQLRYFVAVAEELHFGRAAERLGMAQPPLSRAIRDMERYLGVELLQRTTRKVTLTTAGETLLKDAWKALDAVTSAERRARNAGRPVPMLRVALKADYDAGMLPHILNAFQCDAAAQPVDLILGGRDEQAPALRDGRADIALLVLPVDERGLDIEPLLTEPRLAALAAADPLAARTSLTLADLAGRLLPDGMPAESGGGHARGEGPVKPSTLDLSQIFNLVEVGNIVWFPPLSLVRRHPRPGIAYREVTNLQDSTLAVAWLQDSHSPAVAAFARAAVAVAAETYPTGRPSPEVVAATMG
jgi:DNA-binding transcriptional LysR family regulator